MVRRSFLEMWFTWFFNISWSEINARKPALKLGSVDLEIVSVNRQKGPWKQKKLATQLIVRQVLSSFLASSLGLYGMFVFPLFGVLAIAVRLRCQHQHRKKWDHI
jgi:hypothetical protein